MLYAEDLTYMQTLRKKVFLPKGKPNMFGKGNLIFLFSNSLKESINMMNEKNTFGNNNRYKWYFFNLNYIGKIGTKRYREKSTKERASNYKRVADSTNIMPYKISPIVSPNEIRNTYYDLYKFNTIFNSLTEKIPYGRKMELFWEFYKPIFTDKYGSLTKNYVLINANNYKNFMKGKLKDQIKNPIIMIYYTLKRRFDLISDLDIDFLFYCNGMVMKFNPSKCDEKSHGIYLREIKKLYRGVTIETSEEEEAVTTTKNDKSKESSSSKEDTEPETENDDDIVSEILAPKGVFKVKKSLIGKFVPIYMTNNIPVKSKKKIEKIVVNKLDKSLVDGSLSKDAPKEDKKETAEKIKEEISDEINSDEEMINEIYTQMQKDQVPEKSTRSSARDELLRQEQKKINVAGTTIEELQRKKDVNIKETDLTKVIHSINDNTKHIKFNNFNKTYNENLMNKDITNVFMDLNEKSIKMFVRTITIEDSSDELNHKETWTIKLEDENRVRHTIKVDIPKFIEDKFLWLGGNRKIIKNQDFFLPLVKINPNTVLIVSNYNKFTIQRVDTRSLKGISLIEKFILTSDTTAFEIGNCCAENTGAISTIEYDEYSKIIKRYKSNGVNIYFSQEEIEKLKKEKNIKVKPNEVLIGMDHDKPILLDMDSQTDKDGNSITDIIINSLSKKDKEKMDEITVPTKRLMYTRVTVMKQDCPLAIILCMWEGLSTVLRKAKIQYRLAKNTRDIKRNEDFIRFKNCYLIYKETAPSQLLMNGFKLLKTEKKDISEFETKDGYNEFIEKKFGRMNAINALFNAYEFMLGSIEREILKQINLPTEIVGLCLHANHILCDNQYTEELSMYQSRIRSSEIIAGILYDKIAKAYVPFKNSNGKKKLSIPRDAVIKDLLKQKTVEDYSSLNPFLELESMHGVSTKGFRGINLDDSYTVPKRCFDPTMTGIIGPSSSPDGKVGVNRSLTMEPNIRTARGFVDIKNDKLDELKDVNLFSPAELLIPLGVTKDDTIRTGHSVKQSRHVIPVQKSSPVLISNGSDEMCKYYLSSDFVINAKMDGTVIEKNPKTKIMVVEYKDGTHQAINLDKQIVKNGGGGFELSNILITDLEVGDKFKENETIAWHKDFFKKNKYQGTRLCVGTLAKVAIASSYNTYEDGTFVTDKLSKECTTEMCFKKAVVIGRHSNVTQIVKVGDKIEVDDPLIQFDNSFEEGNINALLDALGDNEELKDSVVSNNKNIVKSKYSGVIEDIKMYSTAELEELSPSLAEIFRAYYNRIKEKKRILNKYDKFKNGVVQCGMVMTETTGKIEPNRYGVIRGEKVNDGVLIEIYIKHEEPLEVGSKIANFTALKNVVGEVLEKGYEPYSEFRPDEEISTFIAPNSILARMTPSILINGLGNKCIIELKRRLREMWDTNKEPISRRKKMQDLIYRFFTAFDKSGSNTKHYKSFFDPMSDNKFNSFFKEFFENDDHYLILTVVDYEHTVHMEDIERAAKVINVPLYEYIFMPHINHNKENPSVSIERVPVGYINIKRTQQTVAKKNGLSTNIDARSAITGQVVQHDKNGRESDLENIMLTSLGLTNTLKELNGPRADDLVMKQQMLQSINTKGYTTLDELDDRIENKTTLNTVDTYFLGMGLKTDLVTKGLRTITNIKKDIE